MLRTELSRVAVILVLAGACNKPIQELRNIRRGVTAGPRVRATVLTVRTTFQPSNRITSSSIVIGDDAARATAEIGTWRLFDFKQNRVAFVDDFAKTYRYETIRSLVERRRDAADEPMHEKIPLAEFSKTGATRAILGLQATQSVVKLGGYHRELWFATHPLIPAGLFALMHASETPSADAPMAERADEGLLAARGFPLLDHSELPYANKRIVVERSVVSIDRRDVAESLLQIPEDYEEVKAVHLARVARPKPPGGAPPPPAATTATATTATTSAAEGGGAPPAKAKAPASHPPASSSHPHDQKTPKGGSRSSGKVRKTP